MSCPETKTQQPCLYLIPTPLFADTDPLHSYSINAAFLREVSLFIVESEKPARAFLKRLALASPLQKLTILEIDKHAGKRIVTDLAPYFDQNRSCGLLSDCGCPAVADPGALVVAEAHVRGYRVRPLIGPSSILLALMSSGLPGQQFTFHGYAPLSSSDRALFISHLESTSSRTGYTQIFMDTPYRTNDLFHFLLGSCGDSTLLSVACNLTAPQEYIDTKSIGAWKKEDLRFDKEPAIFCLWSPPEK